MPMKTKTKIVLVALQVLLAISLAIGAVSAETITVCSSGCNTTTIQAAMDLAVDGDTVTVAAGTYNERVTVYNDITLEGEDKATTIIDGGFSCGEGGAVWNVVNIIADGVTFTNFTVRNGFNGIALSGDYGGVTGVLVEDNIVEDNLIAGITGESSDSNTIKTNFIQNNFEGIALESCNSNLIYNNFLLNDVNARDDGTNDWNTTKTFASNIVGGNHTGGNYWSDYSGADTDSDSLGNTETPHNDTGIQNGGDYHPLVKQSAQDCIDGTLVGGTCILNGPYIGCIEINKNITVDCQNQGTIICEEGPAVTITAEGGNIKNCEIPCIGGTGIGVCTDDATVQGNVIDECETAIYVDGASDGTITDNNITSSSSVGIQLRRSTNQLVQNNIVNGLTHGIRLLNSDGNIIDSNTGDANDYGINLQGKGGSSANTISNNEMTNSAIWDITLNAVSKFNTFVSNTACLIRQQLDNTYSGNTCV
jgi:parallel beta-helix repeat protein